MNRTLHLLLATGAFCTLVAAACAETETSTIECVKTASFLAPIDSPDNRKYAPDREVDVLHLAIEVTPDFKQRTVTGKATFQFKPIAKPVREIKLDAVDLNIQSVTGTEPIQGYQVTADKVIVTFADTIPPGKEASVTIAYDAEPDRGLYFRTPEMGYKKGDTHLFSQGEQIEARHWYPCFDSPNQMFTSEITCHVPGGMTAVSNGRLVSSEMVPASGLLAIHWSQDQPHANYLVTLVAGYLSKIEDKYNNVPLAFYTPPSEINEATNSFRETRDIMAYFEQEIGVPYPWPKYDQLCVNDFVAGGMENTSATTLTDGTLFTAASENIRTSEGLVAHEMAHQWFGDLATCKDWSHIWLNEGFATYYALLYDSHKNGRDSMLYGLYGNARLITGMANDTNAIVRRTYDAPNEMFGYLAYPKGGWVLHMLRSQLGEDLYRRVIKTYLERHTHGNVTTEDLRAVIEELSGRSYDQFFDQWLYHAHHPELEAAYSWDEKTKLAKVSIRQAQKLGDNILLFNFPLTIRFKGKSGTADRAVQVKEKDEDFYFPLDTAPEIVRLDPDYTVLAKTSFNLPNGMLFAQLADKDDVVGRLLAIEQLAAKKDKETVAKLKGTLNGDAFYGVRLEASRALRSIHTDESLTALLASMKQPDARVRRQVLTYLGSFFRETARDAAHDALAHEDNPVIRAAAIRNLAAYANPEVHDAILTNLNSESYRNELADAAIEAMRTQDDPVYIAPLLDALSKREADFTSRGFAQGLGTLAWLARNEDNKDPVREFLIGCVNHKKKSIQLASINALGTLGDPKAAAVVETFATAAKDTPERAAAERALPNLRADKKPTPPVVGVIQEVLDLQKANRDLRKEMDDLKKKVEAKDAAPNPNAKSQKPTAAPPHGKVVSPKEKGYTQ